MAWCVEQLPSMSEVLDSNHSFKKKKPQTQTYKYTQNSHITHKPNTLCQNTHGIWYCFLMTFYFGFYIWRQGLKGLRWL